MRALVIGGSGFIGSNVVDVLLEDGLKVRVFDQSAERFRETPKGVDFRQARFDDTASLAEALADVDVVFHVLSTTVPSTSNIDPVRDIEDNLIGTVRLLELMRAENVRRLIYLSSGGTIYGIPKTQWVSEDHATWPLCSYGIVKSAVEKYLIMEKQLHGLQPVILRASNPYGPRQGHQGVQGVIGTFLSKIIQNEPIHVWGDGSVIRDFVYVGDLARLCLLCAKRNVTGIFNAGSGEGVSINELLDLIGHVTGVAPNPVYDVRREYDVPRIVLDIAAIQNETGWKPEVSLKHGIAETWQWIQNQSRKERRS